MSIADRIDMNLSIKLGGVESPGLTRPADRRPRTRPMSEVLPGERPSYADASEVRGVPGLWLRPIKIQVDGVELGSFGYVNGLERPVDAFVLVRFRVPERDTGRELRLTYRKRINPHESGQEYLAAMVAEALAEVMRHETDEMLFAGAVPRRDPHPNNGQEPV